jgi:hypothetical protein
MNLRIVPTVVLLVTAILLAQTISVVYAHHNDNEDPDAVRETAKKKSEEFEQKEIKEGRSATSDQKRKAYSDYKIAFTAWKSAKELLTTAKSTGVESIISGNQTLVDAAQITRDNAWDTYQEVKKRKLS